MQQTVQTASAAVTLLQFYPVLAAIGGLLFWAGVLTQMLRSALERIGKLENKERDETEVLIELGRLDERMKNMAQGQEKIERELQGVQRSLANIVSGKIGMITKFEQDLN